MADPNRLPAYESVNATPKEREREEKIGKEGKREEKSAKDILQEHYKALTTSQVTSWFVIRANVICRMLWHMKEFDGADIVASRDSYNV